MKKSKITPMQKKVILISLSFVLLIATFFFVFQRNMDAIWQAESNTMKYNRQYANFRSLQKTCDEEEPKVEKKMVVMNKYLKSFPSKVTQTSAIYTLYCMQRDTDVKITAITPGQNVDFFRAGTVTVTEDTTETDKKTTTDDGTIKEDDKKTLATTAPYNVNDPKNEETNTSETTNVSEITGSMNTYTVGFEGSYSEFIKCLTWVQNHKETISLGPTNLSFDSSTGNLTGTVSIIFYAMKGNGVPYKSPDYTNVKIGTKNNVFGTFKKKNN